MKHMHQPLRRLITEPRRCDPEDFDADEIAFEMSDWPDEGEEYQPEEQE